MRPKPEEKSLNRHERRKLRTRRKLKDATLALVLEKGFDAVTIQDIVDRADLGRGTFYVHYQDLQDILWDIIQDGLEDSMGEGRARSGQEGLPPGYLGYRITFETAARHRDLYRVMLGGKGSALITHRVADYLAAAIQGAIASGQFMDEIPFSPEVTAQYVVGALMRLVIWWLETPNDHTPARMADITYTLVHGRSAPQPGVGTE
jgi:AcrR family transcriptional regulator